MHSVESATSSYGNPQVSSEGDIVFVSISETPYKLGRVYCSNRPMALVPRRLLKNLVIISLISFWYHEIKRCSTLLSKIRRKPLD